MTKRRASLSDRPLPQAAAPRATDSAILGAERARQEVVELLLREVMPNRLQPRTQASAAGLDELAESIRQHGVLEPIIVRPIPLTEYDGAGRRYEIVAGERRWRACAAAGRASIPAIVLAGATDDRAMLELAITENLQREDLHPLDEALAFARMQSELGYSYAQIAERLGKSKGYVQNRMRLLQLGEDLQLLVAERPDTLKHVIEIARLSDPVARAALIRAVRDDALSFSQTQARVQAQLAPAPEAGELYSREYDRGRNHKDRQQELPTDVQEVYSREYDRDIHHDEQRPGPPASAGRLLTPRERDVLSALTAKLDRLLDDPDQIHADDWALLSPLALRLGDLLRRLGQARRRSSSGR